MLSTIEKVLRLKDVELFVAIPAEDLAEIARVAGEQPVRRGERLLTAGSPGDGLYVLVEGEVDVVGADGRQLARAHPGDVLGEMSLLLDAPCSGLGTLRRDPDIRWRRSEADLATLAATELAMLRRAAEVVKPGGRLVYATCSSEPEENEQVVSEFLAGRPDFAPVPVRLPGDLAVFITREGHFRTFPFRDRLEPFFAAMLVKTKDLR